MQQIDVNQTVFSLSLVAELVWGIVFALVVRWASKKRWVGQTAWAVTVGVTVTLLIMIPVLGLSLIALLFSAFACSGISMIVEYLTRVQQEIREDNEMVQKLAKGFLDHDGQSEDR